MVLSIDDPRLVESFRAGENEAFEALVRAHRPALYRHALRKLSDHAAAEDAVQETFTRAYKSRGRVGDDWKLGAWLHQICANVCIDEANRRRRESTKASRWATAEVNPHGVAPALEDQLGLDADHSDVVRALRELPTNYQEALELRYVSELEYDEMAEALEISEENVRARVSRANRAIRVLLRPVAAIVAFFAAFSLRRGGKAGRVMAATHDVSTTASTSSSFAPLVETAQAIAIQAPHAMPLISKAAVGIGMLVVATAPATAPLVIDELRHDDRTALEVPSEDATPTDGDATGALPPVDGDDGTSTNGVESGDVVSGEVDTPLVTFAPGVTEFGSQTASEAGAMPAGGATTTDEDPAAPATPAPETPASSGSSAIVVAESLNVVPSGPRFDVAGRASFTIDGRVFEGQLTGRLNVATDTDGEGRQRFDGTLSLVTDEGTVSIVLAGYATANDDSFSTAGRYRLTAAALGVDGTGSFSGSFGSSLRLSLVA